MFAETYCTSLCCKMCMTAGCTDGTDQHVLEGLVRGQKENTDQIFVLCVEQS